MVQILKWILPAMFVTGYAWLGLALRERAIRRRFASRFPLGDEDKPGGETALAPFEFRLWRAISLYALAVSSAGLLTALWPIEARFAEYLPSATKLILIGLLALLAREAIDHAFEAKLIPADGEKYARAWIWTAYAGIFGTLTLAALEISLAPLIAALTLGLFAAAVALRDLLADLAAGAWFARRPPFQLGDHIRVGAPAARRMDPEHESAEAAPRDPLPLEGRVDSIAWNHTALVGALGERMIIPNRRLLVSTITNFGPAGRPALIEARVTISPDVNLDRALKSVAQAAEASLAELAAEMESEAGEFAANGHTDTDDINPPEPKVIIESIGGRGSQIKILLPAPDIAASEALRHHFFLCLHRRLKTDRIGLANEEPGMPAQAIKVAASSR